MSSIAASRLKGGLVLTAHKAESTQRATIEAPIPPELIFPLIVNGGRYATPQVAAGDAVTGGTILAGGGDEGIPILAPTSGKILGIQERPLAHPSGIDGPCVVLQPDGEDQQRSWPLLSAEASAEDIVQRAQEASIPGLGGAGFPAWRKLGAGRRRQIGTLIINGAECEPYISCDDMLMRESATAIIEGAGLIQRALHAGRVLIAIEDDKPEAIAAMRAAVDAAAPCEMQIVALPTRYPEGGERQLIQVLTGAEVPAGGLPADIGMHCQNVATAAALADAALRGKAMRARLVTVTGDAIRQPGNFSALIGTPISALIEAAGGLRSDPECLIMGGPLMGFALSSDQAGITPSTNCIIVAAPGELTARELERACIRCGDCAEVCPAGLLPQQLHWAIRSRNLDEADQLHVSACIECGCCDLVCPSQIPLTDHFRFAKQEITLRRLERERSDIARQRFENRAARLARLASQRAERLAAKRAARGIGKVEAE